jgi:SAM-dependent methyltransferase
MEDNFIIFPIKKPRNIDEWYSFESELLLKQKYADKVVWKSEEMEEERKKRAPELIETTYESFYQLLASDNFPIRPGKDRFLDLGSGLGNIVMFLSYIIGCSVTGIEIDKTRHFESISRREIYERATSTMYMNELIPEDYEIVNYGDYSLVFGDFFLYRWKPFSRLFSRNENYKKIITKRLFGKFLLECLPGSILIITALPDNLNDVPSHKMFGYPKKKMREIKKLYDVKIFDKYFLFIINENSANLVTLLRKTIIKEFSLGPIIAKELFWPPISEMTLNRWQLIYEDFKNWIPSSKVGTYDPGFIDMIMRTCPISENDFMSNIDEGWNSKGLPLRKLPMILYDWNDKWFFQLAQIVIQFGRIPIFFNVTDDSIIGSKEKLRSYMKNIKKFWFFISHLMDTITTSYKDKSEEFPLWIHQNKKIPYQLIIPGHGFTERNGLLHYDPLDIEKIYKESVSIFPSILKDFDIKEEIDIDLLPWFKNNSQLLVINRGDGKSSLESTLEILRELSEEISFHIVILHRSENEKLLIEENKKIRLYQTLMIERNDVSKSLSGIGTLYDVYQLNIIPSQRTGKEIIHNNNIEMSHMNHVGGIFNPMRVMQHEYYRRTRYDQQLILPINTFPETLIPHYEKDRRKKLKLSYAFKESLDENIRLGMEGVYATGKDISSEDYMKKGLTDFKKERVEERGKIKINDDLYLVIEHCPEYSNPNIEENLYFPCYYVSKKKKVIDPDDETVIENNIKIYGGSIPLFYDKDRVEENKSIDIV